MNEYNPSSQDNMSPETTFLWSFLRIAADVGTHALFLNIYFRGILLIVSKMILALST
jgi:hypothetical protein